MSEQPPARVERDGSLAVIADRPASGATNASIAARLEETRARTLLLIDGVSERALNEVHDPLMSPIAWDLGHIATFEDLWLAQNPFDRPPLRGDLGAVYDPSTAPRNERGALPYLRVDDALRHMEAVRERTLGLLEGADLGESGDALLADGIRLRAGPAPRAAALRDDPPDAPDHDDGALRAARAAGSPPGRADRGRDGVRARRARSRWARRHAASRTTTSARVTRAPWRRS